MNTDSSDSTKRASNVAPFVVIMILGLSIALLAASGTLTRWFADEKKPTTAPTGQLWTCGMHPQVIQDHPGDCPICHMELTPVKAALSSASADGGMPSVTIDPAVVQNMGVRTAEVVRGPLRSVVRAVGVLAEAEPNIHDVNLRVSGWVEKLYANTVDMHVNIGDPLFDLYSPQLQTAVEEFIAARKASASTRSTTDELTNKSTAAMSESAERKLLLLGVQKEEIARLVKLDRAPRTVTFTSPVGGHVTEKTMVEGAAVKEGERALRIVDHTKLWLDAQVFESQLPLVKVGQKTTATIASVPGKTFEGEIAFIHPHVEAMTRSVMVRLAIPNESMELRPGMYGTVEINAELAGEVVLVPREAVIDTGTRQISFLAREAGHFEPRDVRVGLMTPDGMVQVLEGLSPGEKVVTSGQFLIDAESRMKEAIQKHLNRNASPPKTPNVPTTMQVAQTAPSPVTPATSPAVTAVEADKLVSAYLALSDFFGKPAQGDQPANVQPVIDAAKNFIAAMPSADAQADAALAAASAMKDRPVDEQRKLFKTLSAAVIALVEHAPLSRAVADKLFVMHCPMADEHRGADWIQATDVLANPFFAKSMKQCGSVEKTIQLRASR